MKTFEEKYTAWVDGRLSGTELDDFEVELKARSESFEEKDSLRAMGDFLRAHTEPIPLKNVDFFNHQLMQQIEAEARSAPAPASPATSVSPFPFFRMILAGSFLLLISGILGVFLIPRGHQPDVAQLQQATPPVQHHVLNVLNARPGDAGITATSFHATRHHGTVLWLDGLNYIPADHKLK